MQQCKELEQEQIQQIVASLRDLVYLRSTSNNTRNDSDSAPVVRDLEEIIQSVSDVLPGSLVDSYSLNGLTFTPCPTQTHRVIRWINTECYDCLDDAQFEELFLRHPDSNLIMAFCNIDDLYFHNVENIIPLDNMFRDMPESLQVSDVNP